MEYDDDDNYMLPRYNRRESDIDANGIDRVTGERRKYDFMADIMKNKLDIEVVKQNVSSIKHNDLKIMSDDINDMHDKIDKVEDKIDRVTDMLQYTSTFIKYGGIIIGAVFMSVVVPILLTRLGS